MTQLMAVSGIVTVKRLSSHLYLNPTLVEFTEQDLGSVLEYAPKLPVPLPTIRIPLFEESLKKSTLSIAPPELYIFTNPIGAN